jgi:hypothetical protein
MSKYPYNTQQWQRLRKLKLAKPLGFIVPSCKLKGPSSGTGGSLADDCQVSGVMRAGQASGVSSSATNPER